MEYKNSFNEDVVICVTVITARALEFSYLCIHVSLLLLLFFKIFFNRIIIIIVIIIIIIIILDPRYLGSRGILEKK